MGRRPDRSGARIAWAVASLVALAVREAPSSAGSYEEALERLPRQVGAACDFPRGQSEYHSRTADLVHTELDQLVSQVTSEGISLNRTLQTLESDYRKRIALEIPGARQRVREERSAYDRLAFPRSGEVDRPAVEAQRKKVEQAIARLEQLELLASVRLEEPAASRSPASLAFVQEFRKQRESILSRIGALGKAAVVFQGLRKQAKDCWFAATQTGIPASEEGGAAAARAPASNPAPAAGYDKNTGGAPQ
jgi:hypothetical protein